jgi:hypothetical protein
VLVAVPSVHFPCFSSQRTNLYFSYFFPVQTYISADRQFVGKVGDMPTIICVHYYCYLTQPKLSPTIQELHEAAIEMDESIDDIGASAMADVIQAQMQLTLTHTQIRQISTIISEHNEMSKSAKSQETIAPVPDTVVNLLKDNSSGSITSALTDTSHVGRASTEQEGKKNMTRSPTGQHHLQMGMGL